VEGAVLRQYDPTAQEITGDVQLTTWPWIAGFVSDNQWDRLGEFMQDAARNGGIPM
jgi:hypothetical protein